MSIVDAALHSPALSLPQQVTPLPRAVLANMPEMDLRETAYVVCGAMAGRDFGLAEIKKVISEKITFSIPIIETGPDRYSPIFDRGPSKQRHDLGVQMFAGLLDIANKTHTPHSPLRLITIGSNGRGAALAHALQSLDYVSVYALYPASEIAIEAALLSGHHNITPIAVKGNTSDCTEIINSLCADAQAPQQQICRADSFNIAIALPYTAAIFFLANRLALKNENIKQVTILCGDDTIDLLIASLIAIKMGLKATCIHLTSAETHKPTLEALKAEYPTLKILSESEYGRLSSNTSPQYPMLDLYSCSTQSAPKALKIAALGFRSVKNAAALRRIIDNSSRNF